ncbi:MAG: hypothetical protein J7M34_05690 [Anaerolineae bacterium]|nr:hypothetical protein [Anaerolineae bacterium]
MKTFLSRWLRRRKRSGVIRPELQRWLDTAPQASVRVIVRVTEDPQSCRPAIESMGLNIHRVFQLVPGLAVEGPATAVLALADQPWVTSIEIDRAVHPMPKERDT